MKKSRKQKAITIQKYREFPFNQIFADGIGLDGNEDIRWMALKLENGKWAFIYERDVTDEYPIMVMKIKKRACRIIDCDEEVASLFT